MMQNNIELKCPEHHEILRYVCVDDNEEIANRILCEFCVSNKRGGNMNGLKLLGNSIDEMKKKNIQFGNFLYFKDKCTQEIDRIKSKMNGIFDCRPYLSIKDDPSLKLQDLQKAAHSFYQNKLVKDEELILPELIKLSIEAANSFRRIADEFEQKQKEIKLGSINWNDGNIQYNNVDTIEKIQEINLIDVNFDENIVLVDLGQTMQLLQLENNKLISKNIINNNYQTQNQSKKTCLIKVNGESKIIVGYLNGYLEIWEQSSDGKYYQFHRFQAHKNNLNCMVYDNYNKILITGGDEKDIICWRFQQDKVAWVFAQSLEQHTKKINSLSFNSKNTLLASCSNDESFSIWQLDKDFIWTLALVKVEYNQVNTICFINDDNLVIQLFEQRFILIYKLNYTQNSIQLYSNPQRIDLDYINTNIIVKIQPKFYKEAGLLILQSDLQQAFIKQIQNQEYKKLDIELKKIKMIRLFNFGKHFVYFEEDSNNYQCYALKLVQVENK